MALTKSLSFSLGRKRILISKNNSSDLQQFCADFEAFKPSKRHCNGENEEGDELRFVKPHSSFSLLEALPQELLIKVVCGVNHEDLNQLFQVSKSVREAAIIAKKSHFAYSTPSKMKVFRNSIDLINHPIEFNDEEFEAPNAPKQVRRLNRPKISRKKLDDISVALFADECVENYSSRRSSPRRSLFSDEAES